MRIFSLPELERVANTIRQDIIRMLVESGTGHAAGPLGMADVFTALYFHILNYRPNDPNWSHRDRLLLSNGHICPVLYASLARAGYFRVEELQKLRKFGSRLQGHPSRIDLPGVENSSGPLGQGISQAVGMALAGKMDKDSHQIFCVTSDGEHNEGQTWEAILCAGKYKLHNLTVIIDRNNIQIGGFTEAIMPIEPLREKYEAFNWLVLDVDGHSFDQIIDAVQEARSVYEKPVCIIAHTVPGKGVSFMENKPEWHGKAPSVTEAQQALAELQAARRIT